jgi:hypothetical protein
MPARQTTRLARLERRNADRLQSSRGRRIDTPRDWLNLFDELGARGFFKQEPDFPFALELFREAVDRGDQNPAEWLWLAEMHRRVLDSKPPVTEAEYEALKQWYFRHEKNVYNVFIRFKLACTPSCGPRLIRATETVEELRKMRTAHPELK